MGAAPAPPRALRGSPAGTPRRSLALSQSHAGGASWPGARRSATGCHRRQGASASGGQVTGCPPPAFLSLRSNGSHWLLTPAVRKDSSRSDTAQFQGRKLGWWRRRHRPGVPREPEWPGFRHPGRVSGDPFTQRSACSRLSGRTRGALRCPTDRGAQCPVAAQGATRASGPGVPVAFGGLQCHLGRHGNACDFPGGEFSNQHRGLSSEPFLTTPCFQNAASTGQEQSGFFS